MSCYVFPDFRFLLNSSSVLNSFFVQFLTLKGDRFKLIQIKSSLFTQLTGTDLYQFCFTRKYFPRKYLLINSMITAGYIPFPIVIFDSPILMILYSSVITLPTSTSHHIPLLFSIHCYQLLC